MSAFKQLKDISINFENQLQYVATELFSANIGESFENGLSKKMQDLTFLTSKLRLLRAKQLASFYQDYINIGEFILIEIEPHDHDYESRVQNYYITDSVVPSTRQVEYIKRYFTKLSESDQTLIELIKTTPQIAQQPKTESTIKGYEEVAQWKVLEQCIVKSLTQAHAVKALVTTSDMELSPDLVERKQKIISTLKEYRLQETQYRQLDEVCREKETELAAVRMLWEQELVALQEMREESQGSEDCDDSGPLYRKLRTIVNKLELIRWVICRVVSGRGAQQWAADVSRVGHVLPLTRQTYTVQSFLD